MSARIERFRIIAIVVVVFALLGAGLTAYSLSQKSTRKQPFDGNDVKVPSAEAVKKVKEVLTADRESGEAEGCPAGTRVDFFLVGNNLS